MAGNGVFTAAAGSAVQPAGAVGMARYQRVRIAQPICHGLLVVAVGELSVVVTVV
jgi:hypothetical protein